LTKIAGEDSEAVTKTHKLRWMAFSLF